MLKKTGPESLKQELGLRLLGGKHLPGQALEEIDWLLAVGPYQGLSKDAVKGRSPIHKKDTAALAILSDAAHKAPDMSHRKLKGLARHRAALSLLLDAVVTG